MELPNGFTIEQINTKIISKYDLQKIAELEKDMWARGLGEYVKCKGCGNINSKHDIYGKLEKDIYYETVSKIEQILAIDSIKCTQCGSDTDFIYGESEYINEIIERYSKSDSYLSIYRNESGDILGFMDGYIDSFEIIYKREFEYFYGKNNFELIKNEIVSKIEGLLPNKILICSSLGMKEKYQNFLIVLSLIKSFFNSIDDNKNSLLGITEVKKGSYIYALYKIMGAINLGIPNNILINKQGGLNYKYGKYDLLIHSGVIGEYKNKLNIPIKDFFRQNKKIIRQIATN